jgi:hypothetical protein
VRIAKADLKAFLAARRGGHHDLAVENSAVGTLAISANGWFPSDEITPEIASESVGPKTPSNHSSSERRESSFVEHGAAKLIPSHNRARQLGPCGQQPLQHVFPALYGGLPRGFR